jgi:hypothetical protein
MTDRIEPDELARRYADAIGEGRPDESAALLDSSGDVAEAAGAVAAAAHALFQRRDLAAMIAAAEVGVAWCLARASDAGDAEAAREARRRAQAIAFNAAANCWPGWDDAGVVVTDDHVARGLALALRSRDLVRELALGDDRIGTSHWLLGALELAAGRFDSAEAAFARSTSAFASLGADSPEALMAHGYLSLARKLRPDAGEAGARELASAIECLRALEGRKGAFFADQISTADRVFEARSAGHQDAGN